MSDSNCAEWLPGDGWEPVGDGESGASVLRSVDGARYAKCAVGERADELAEERDRVEWLAAQGIPGPTLLDWIETDAGACLITAAVAGVPASAVSAAELGCAWQSIAHAVRRLHELPTRDCPFGRGLAEMFGRARDVVERKAVDPDFLSDEQRMVDPEVLLERLVPQLEHRFAQEAAGSVVCHGDLCLPNIVLDPRTWEVAGFIDLGRLGTADPHADFALLLANSRETWPDEERARAADGQFARAYGVELDAERLRFYLDLDPLTWG
ncbi:APH(3'') family aminoglycoside O-phosphotransferase [Nocardia sp. CDC159]|uniref:APH(3'') family aminoglycoside O-phosphotransferase n=1 Tax=Nocardia pulmonis TaxID=2951408 RepID=A0A9X2IV31_9NOCA|nr:MULTISPECIES: APH(3'') family aminoglycoside O-phosphotransferase [Nocardia]MCM6773467.1 APH(3'') family aminoglycoside O-phosphotransferase [Nocardia pulmonis]MCM6786354.1 APH(3'') family aminoglycoside O-phosphotransferase [Nocardia sp. CDC159]